MSHEEQTAVAGDCRRAAALVAHNSQGNIDGFNAVLREAAEADRVTPLFSALLDLFEFLLPELRSEAGIATLRQGIARLAGYEQ